MGCYCKDRVTQIQTYIKHLMHGYVVQGFTEAVIKPFHKSFRQQKYLCFLSL